MDPPQFDEPLIDLQPADPPVDLPPAAGGNASPPDPLVDLLTAGEGNAPPEAPPAGGYNVSAGGDSVAASEDNVSTAEDNASAAPESAEHPEANESLVSIDNEFISDMFGDSTPDVSETKTNDLINLN